MSEPLVAQYPAERFPESPQVSRVVDQQSVLAQQQRVVHGCKSIHGLVQRVRTGGVISDHRNAARPYVERSRVRRYRVSGFSGDQCRIGDRESRVGMDDSVGIFSCPVISNCDLRIALFSALH